MSFSLHDRAKKVTVGHPSAKALLLALATFADDDGTNCFPGQEALRQMTELSLDTIQRQLKFLVERGLVRAEKSRRKGQWANWTYTITLPDQAAPTGPVDTSQAAPCGSVDQAALCGVAEDHQAAPCGLTKPHLAAQPSRTMRPYSVNYSSKDSSRTRAPSRPDGLGAALPEEIAEREWDDILGCYAKSRRWTKHVGRYGSEPGSSTCRAPRHLLLKHGLATEVAA